MRRFGQPQYYTPDACNAVVQPSTEFRFAYEPPVIRYGAGSAGALAGELGELGFDRALVVCGKTVGERPTVLDPVRDGLGDRLVGVFAETTPEKRLETAVECARRARELDADVLLGLGGASSLDIARVASVVAASAHSPEELGAQLVSTATLSVPDDPLPVVAVPTTLAGGSLSMLAGVTADPESGLVTEAAGGGVGDPKLMPALAVYDPDLVATTPREVLAGSAMNGFSKGLETLYSSAGTPITDSTASDGLTLLSHALPELGENPGRADIEAALRGTLLSQYGVSRATGTTFSVVHALGHSLRIHTGVQLGVAHAAVAPHALAWLFEHVDGRRDLLATALEVDDRDDPAAAVVDTVKQITDGLRIAGRLRDLPGIERSTLDDVAGMAADSFLLANDAPGRTVSETDAAATAHSWSGSPHAPPGLEVSSEAMRGVLDAAW